MAATVSRHSSNYATHYKSLPVTMPPSKAPVYQYPTSRVAASPPDLSETSSTSYRGGSRHSAGSYSVGSNSSNYAPSHSSGEYENYVPNSNVDVMDMLSDRMNSAFDPIRMDKTMVQQAQTSGRMNAKERELRELQDMAQRRLKRTQVKFDEALEDRREIERDTKYIMKKTAAMKSKAEKMHPEAYAKAQGRRHAPRA